MVGDSWAFDLCLTLKTCKDDTRKMLVNIVKQQPNFKVGNQIWL